MSGKTYTLHDQPGQPIAGFYTVREDGDAGWSWLWTEGPDGEVLDDSADEWWPTPWEALRAVADNANETISHRSPIIRSARALATRLERSLDGRESREAGA